MDPLNFHEGQLKWHQRVHTIHGIVTLLLRVVGLRLDVEFVMMTVQYCHHYWNRRCLLLQFALLWRQLQQQQGQVATQMMIAPILLQRLDDVNTNAFSAHHPCPPLLPKKVPPNIIMSIDLLYVKSYAANALQNRDPKPTTVSIAGYNLGSITVPFATFG